MARPTASAMQGLLGPDGPIAHHLEGYAPRPGQIAMAEAVERTLDEDRVLLCEAGTGTGKTLAYLVPVLQSGRKVVISTASKTLQDQIVHRDLPNAQRCLGTTRSVVVMKGLANYLCLRRFHEFRDDIFSQPPAAQRALPMVEQWARSTTSGDIASGPLPPHDGIWRRITSSSDTRLGQRCEHHDACFVTRVKRAAEHADIIVVNHHLFFADLAIRGEHPAAVLPAYDAVIFDEAHKIDDVATQFFGARVASRRVERLVKDALRIDDQSIKRTAHLARTANQDFFEAANAIVDPRQNRVGLPPESWSGPLQTPYHQADDALGALEDALRESDHPRTDGLARRTSTARQSLTQLADNEGNYAMWLERGEHGVAIIGCPAYVGEVLARRLFSMSRPVVMTSASLSTDGSFDFTSERLGLTADLPTPVEMLEVDTPLDYATQAVLYTPADIPNVDDDGYVAQASERLAELLELQRGGAFVLCTSHKAVREFSRELKARVPDRPVLSQETLPRRELLTRFREEGHAVLVATMGFWEGIDVPGSALELVAIMRLPFSRPNDPIIAARYERIERSGGNAFSSYSVPQAALILKQGIGRLLRAPSDRGVVSIFDKRVVSRSYGQRLIQSLPPLRQTRDFDDVRQFWWRQTGEEPSGEEPVSQ